MSSKNHGRSWKVSNPTGEISSECQNDELLDGSVMLNMRSSRDKARMHRAVMVTKDLGKTWTPHPTHHKELIEPVCNGSTIRITYIQDGRKQRLCYSRIQILSSGGKSIRSRSALMTV